MDKTNKYRNHSFICKQCQESFIQKNHKKLGTVSFCSRKCKAKSLTTPSIKKNCINCNSEYLCSIQQENRSSFCNRKCLEIHRNNKKVGVCDWCEQDVRRRAMFVSDKMFCSHRCQSDSKNYYTEPLNYRKKKIWFNIINNIDLKCESCEIKDIDVLTVHHMDFNKSNDDIMNLMLLCYNCHYKIHHNGTIAIRKYILQLEKNHVSAQGRKEEHRKEH